MRVAVLANLKKNAPKWEGMSPDHWDDLDSPKTVESIAGALRSGGHEAEFFEASILAPHNLVEKLLNYRPNLCFNIAESHFGDGREAQIPGILEMLRIPYTGSQVLTLALALDKPMTKRVLTYHGLPTPEFQVFERADDPIDEDLLLGDELRYPMFVKPSREGTSVGVTARSIVRTVAELRELVGEQLARYDQPILCEHYIQGREVTIGLVGNLAPTTARRINERTAPNILPHGLTMFPALEIDTGRFAETEQGVYTNRMKVELADTEYYYLCPAPLEGDSVYRLQLLAATVFRVIGCKDVARVDFRLDEFNNDQPYILEVNPLPGLSPDYSDLVIEAYAAGWTYPQLINTIVELAAARHGVGAAG